MKALIGLLAGILMFATLSRADQFKAFSEELPYFYLKPTKDRYVKLQADADRFASKVQKQGNGADLLVAVMIAKISEKYHWGIAGEGRMSAMAREITKGNSRLAKYVASDTEVDPSKLDIWWVNFFATGETEYLGKILRYAETPKGGPLGDMVVKWAAAWSFKSNCKQHKAIAAFARECLRRSLFPGKREFLKECISHASN